MQIIPSFFLPVFHQQEGEEGGRAGQAGREEEEREREGVKVV